MTVKLTDFGIARAIEQTRITQVGSVVGTAAYLAPEQVRGEEATPATDVYALGVVLYQFLTGRLPYEGSSLAELAVRQQNEKPLPPSTYNDEVPETLGAAVLRALEGDPNRRYASADELAGGPAAGARRRGRDPAARRGRHAADQRARRRHRRDPPHRPRHRPDRVPPGAVPDPAPGAAGRRRRRRPRPRARRRRRQQPRKRGGFSRFVRFVLALVALVLVAAAVATARDRRHRQGGRRQGRRKVAGDTVDKVVEEVKDLVNNNKE